jgi:hypothetical protein
MTILQNKVYEEVRLRSVTKVLNFARSGAEYRFE